MKTKPLTAIIIVIILLMSTALIFQHNLKLENKTKKTNTNKTPDTREYIWYFSSRDELPSLRNIKIKHEYRVFPALLVEANPQTMENLVQIYGGKYVPNEIYELIEPIEGITPKYTTTNTTQLIGAPDFWNNGYMGNGTTVCVIDSGINSSHPELAGKVILERSFVSTIYGFAKNDTSPNDVLGHGTAVAGIIAGKGLQPAGQGVAPGTKIMNAKVFNSDGKTTTAAIIAAIEWAVYGDDGIPHSGDDADIINMSLGGGQIYGSPLWWAIERAVAEGVLVVTAAGNNGDWQYYSMSINDPANSPLAIAVGATDAIYSSFASYSSIGPNLFGAVKPDIVAPSGITTLTPNGYSSTPMLGTSFSAPHVSGGLALILQFLYEKGFDPSSAARVGRLILLSSASDFIVSISGGYAKYEDLAVGFGALNLSSAYGMLSSSYTNSSDYPQILEALPHKIPVGISNDTSNIIHEAYFPYFDRVFIGSEIAFNMTIFTAKQTNISVVLQGNFTTALQLYSNTSLTTREPVSLWEFNATVLNVTEGYYSGWIIINDTVYNISVSVPIAFLVVKPRLRVLFDLKHSSWVIDQRWGQYRLLVRYFEKKNNISVEYYPFSADPISYGVLAKYNIVFVPDAASQYNIYDSNGTILQSVFTNMLDTEISAFRQYLSDGGLIVIYALDAESHNITNINKMTGRYGMKLTNESWYGSQNTISASMVGGHLLTFNVSNLPYYGLSLNTDVMPEVFLNYNDSGTIYNLGGIFQGFDGGAIILLGSNFMFDNWAFMGSYVGSGTLGSNPKQFVSNIIRLVDENYYFSVDTNLTSTVVLPNTTVSIEIRNITPLIDVEVSAFYGDRIERFYPEYNGTTGTWNLELRLVEGGIHYIRVKGYVELGNSTLYIVRAQRIIVDAEPPRILLVGQQDRYIPEPQNISIIFEVIDDSVILFNETEYTSNITSVSSLEILNYSYGRITFNITSDTLRALTIGQNKNYVHIQINITSRDTYGHTVSKTSIISVYIDTTPPTIELSGLENFSYIGGTLEIYVTATDTISGVSWVTISINGSIYYEGQYSPGPIEIDTTQLPDGNYTLLVEAKDLVNNTARLTVFFVVDNTPPTISVIGLSEGQYVRETVNMSIIIEDASPSSATVYLDGLYIGSGATNFTVSINTTKLTDGLHLIRIYATDEAGNSAIYDLNFTSDNTPPNLTILNVSRFVSRGSVYLVVEVWDNLALQSAYVYVDGNLLDILDNGTQEVEIYTGTLDDGNHTLSVLAIDMAYNLRLVDTWFILDTTPPKVIYDGIKNNTKIYDSFILNISIIENLSGIRSVRVFLDHTKIFESENSEISVLINVSKLEFGLHEITIVAMDKANNQRIIKIVFYLAQREGEYDYGAILVFGVLGLVVGLIAGFIVWRKRKKETEFDF